MTDNSILLVGWSIGIIGAVIAIAGGIYFLLSLRAMGSEIKKGLSYIFIASFIWTVYSIIIIFFAVIELEITNTLWIIIPLFYTLTSVLFIIGTARLMNFFAATKQIKRRN